MKPIAALLALLAAFLALPACSSTTAEWAAVYEKAANGEPGAREMIEAVERGAIVNCTDYFTPSAGEGKVYASPDFGGWCLHFTSYPGYEIRSEVLTLYWQDGTSVQNRLIQSIKTKSWGGTNYGQRWWFYDNVNFGGDYLGGGNCNGQVSTQVLAPGGSFGGVASFYWANITSGGSACP